MSAGEEESRFQVMMIGTGSRGIRQEFRYRVEAGDAVSEEFTVFVEQPPSAMVTEVSYVFPEYMHLEARSSSNPNIDGWDGTELQVSAQTNIPVKTAVLKFSDDAQFTVPAEEYAMTVSGKNLEAGFRLEYRDGGPKFFRIEVKDSNGRRDPRPTIYGVNIRPDMPPTIRLLDPTTDLEVPANAVVPLLIEAEDPDFLLNNVEFSYEINGQEGIPDTLYNRFQERPLK